MRKIEYDDHPDFEKIALDRMEDAIDAAWESTLDLMPCVDCAKGVMMRQIEMRARRETARQQRRNASAIANASAPVNAPGGRSRPQRWPPITDDDIPF